jgi:hypothetical protein
MCLFRKASCLLAIPCASVVHKRDEIAVIFSCGGHGWIARNEECIPSTTAWPMIEQSCNVAACFEMTFTTELFGRRRLHGEVKLHHSSEIVTLLITHGSAVSITHLPAPLIILKTTHQSDCSQRNFDVTSSQVQTTQHKSTATQVIR